MKAQITMTVTLEYDINPEAYPAECETWEDMVAFDVKEYYDDPVGLMENSGVNIHISGELATDFAEMAQRAKDDQSFKALLTQWSTMKGDLAKGCSEEMNLRKAIANTLFPDGKEGTNKCYVEDVVVKAVLKINRSVDKGRLVAHADEFEEHGISVDSLVSYSPELKVGPYRKLSETQRAVFDQALTIREGAPELEIM